MRVPIDSAMDTDTMPTVNEMRAPWMMRLRRSRPNSSVPRRWDADAQGTDAIDFLKTRLKTRLGAVDHAISFADDPPTVILVVGVNGSGKTTSVAKIARSLKDRGLGVLVAAADTFRAGATAQLEIWTERSGTTKRGVENVALRLSDLV